MIDIEQKQTDLDQLVKKTNNLKQTIDSQKVELNERDATIKDKDAKIQELRKKTQELEKFKFVLDYKIKDLKEKLEPARFLTDDMTVLEAMEDMKKTFFDQYPVIQRKLGEQKVVGMITTQLLMSKLANCKVTPSDPISKVMTRDFRNMSSDMPISELSRVLERQNFVFIDSTHIVSSYDVLEFMSKKADTPVNGV